MKRKLSILMLGIAVMLASCSQDENTLQTHEKGKTVTFTATLDGNMKLRATRSVTDPTDEPIDRAVLEIYDAQKNLVGSRIQGTISGDNITFTADLEERETYTCLFWADEKNGYDITDLRAIKRNTNLSGYSIAYYTVKEITVLSEPVAVTLTHAVAKVVLHETGTLEADDMIGVSFTWPAYTFDVTDGSCTATGDNETISYISQIVDTGTGDVCGGYVFVPAEETNLTTVTLSYTASGGSEKTKEISNVPLMRNYRTVLKGEFAKIGLLTQEFNVTLDKNWEGDFKRLVSTAAGQIAADETLIAEAIDTHGALVIEGPVSAADISAVGQWGRENPGMLRSIDLSGTTGLTEINSHVFWFNAADGISSLTSVVLPSSLQTIGASVFQCNGLVEIEIPESVTSIGSSCFTYCSALERITLPEGLTAIRNSTFSYCSALKGITIPAKVVSIGYVALHCAALETLVFEGSLPVISSSEENPDEQSEQLVLNNNIMGYPSPVVTGFNVFLPNITDETTAETYHTFFTTAAGVYYNYTGGDAGDKADTDNYTYLNNNIPLRDTK